jgi:hypothetical protein
MLRVYSDIFVCSNVGHARHNNVYIMEHVCNMLFCKAIIRLVPKIVLGGMV